MPTTSLPFIRTSIVLKGHNIVNLFFLLCKKEKSTYYCTFQAYNYPQNRLANLRLFNPSVFVGMCSTSFLFHFCFFVINKTCMFVSVW